MTARVGRAAPALLLLSTFLTGCGSLTRLSEIGRPPAMTPSSDPTQEPSYRPLTMPMPTARIAEPHANALWRNGSRAFFKDQRAASVGDILTVVVNISDTADFTHATNTTRTGAEGMGVPNLFGVEKLIPTALAGAVASSLVSTSSTNSNVATGEAKRAESVQISLAGIVTQVLPNGNLVVSAHQEVRVNGELRDLQLSGVVRPQDIASDNTVQHTRMAEARISYGGRGQITDVQTPRWGQQLMDVLLPF